jgi:hypothetical protein
LKIWPARANRDASRAANGAESRSSLLFFVAEDRQERIQLGASSVRAVITYQLGVDIKRVTDEAQKALGFGGIYERYLASQAGFAMMRRPIAQWSKLRARGQRFWQKQQRLRNDLQQPAETIR